MSASIDRSIETARSIDRPPPSTDRPTAETSGFAQFIQSSDGIRVGDEPHSPTRLDARARRSDRSVDRTHAFHRTHLAPAAMLAAALPMAPYVVPFLPLALPRNRVGLRRIRAKYADVAPVVPVTTKAPFKGEFPERDVMGNSLLAHVAIVWGIVNRLLAAAAKIAEEKGDDAPEALGLTLWALAFLTDQFVHLYIAGDATNERAADENVMQRGHKMGLFAFTALATSGGVVMGEKVPLWCEAIPDHGFATLGARVLLNKALIAPLAVWQTLHAFGVFGGEGFSGGEKTKTKTKTTTKTTTTTKKPTTTTKTTSKKASKKISENATAAAESVENAAETAAAKTVSSFASGFRASFRAPAA